MYQSNIKESLEEKYTHQAFIRAHLIFAPAFFTGIILGYILFILIK